VPTVDADGTAIRTRIARNPGGRDFPPTAPRSPFGRHVFAGGNTLVLSMLRDHSERLRVDAPAESLEAILEATRVQLEERSARLAIRDVRRDGRALRVELSVENLAGHKLPTAHPTRRAWLRLRVLGQDGTLLFASGEVDARGRIVDGAGRPLASELAGGPVPPHRDAVRGQDEVVLYEAVMADADGAPTHTLLRGAAWLKDTRLLPRGWEPDHPEAERIAPVGTLGDEDFGPGGDLVRYELELEYAGPLRIEADLLYQPLGARWAAELLRWDTPEVALFRELWDAADVAPEVLASVRLGG
jgi:hypothetical protein